MNNCERPNTNGQLSFDLRLPAGRPLVPIEAVMVLIDRDEDDILNLVELGKLRWAFDISSPGTKRRELRIHRESVLEYLSSSHEATKDTNLISGILPKPTLVQAHATIRGTELGRRFSCCQWLVANLIDTGELSLAPIPVTCKVSPFIDHASALAFLLRRCLNNAQSAIRNPQSAI